MRAKSNEPTPTYLDGSNKLMHYRHRIMGARFCCTSSIAPASVDKDIIGKRNVQKSTEPQRRISLVHRPAPPSTSSSSMEDSKEPRKLLGSFCSRASLRIFRKQNTRDTNLSINEDCSELLLNNKYQKYRIKRILGKGNFSCVVMVEDEVSNVEYAMKIIKRTTSTISGVSCERELEVLKKVQHPNIVYLHEAHLTEARIYLLLELATGGDLSTRLIEVGRFTEDFTKRVLMEILGALEYLHRHGVTHRDLKLENCLFKTKSEDSIILLSDFGLAHLQPISCEKEAMQTTCGTENYISPEMLNGELYTNAIDLWALGIIMYAMLCGNMPFNDNSRARLYMKIRKCLYSLSDEIWLSVSSQALDFLSHLLCIDPKARLTATTAQNHLWIIGKQ